MKRWIVLAVVLLIAGGAIVVSERRKVEAPVSPGAVLTMAADLQRGASRVPAVVTRISDAEEIQIGDSMAARAAMMGMDASRDPDAAVIEAYIQKIGSHVAARAQRKLPYRFHYVAESGFDNAFALPGGHVFIGKGLLAEMDSEDQLAAVLGHEIEHIDRRHCVERVQLEAQTRKLPLVGAVAQIPLEIFQAGYTKNQELEADSEGTRLSVRAGYSYQGAVRLFEAMEKKHGKATRGEERKSLRREIGKLAVQTVVGYFQSHPPAAERIRLIRELAERENWQARSEKPLPAAVAQRLKSEPEAPTAETTAGGRCAPPRQSPTHRVEPSAMEQRAISQPLPVYPQIARMASVQGDVVLQVVIDTDGAVACVRVISGHPMLQQAAIDAVRKCRYRPYLLKGKPVDVETDVTVNFSLGSS